MLLRTLGETFLQKKIDFVAAYEFNCQVLIIDIASSA